MLLPVLNQPVTTYAKQIMAFMSYRIALPVMIKGKLTKCCVIMKVKAVKSIVCGIYCNFTVKGTELSRGIHFFLTAFFIGRPVS